MLHRVLLSIQMLWSARLLLYQPRCYFIFQDHHHGIILLVRICNSIFPFNHSPNLQLLYANIPLLERNTFWLFNSIDRQVGRYCFCFCFFITPNHVIRFKKEKQNPLPTVFKYQVLFPVQIVKKIFVCRCIYSNSLGESSDI